MIKEEKQRITVRSWISSVALAAVISFVAVRSINQLARNAAELERAHLQRVSLLTIFESLPFSRWGYTNWYEGQVVEYTVQKRRYSREEAGGTNKVVRFEFVRSVKSTGMDLSWVRISGTRAVRSIPEDAYILARPGILSASGEFAAYTYIHGYIPSLMRIPPDRVMVREAMSEKVLVENELLNGKVDATKIIAHVGDRQVSVWLSPEAGPFGVVQLDTTEETFILTRLGFTSNTKVPEILEPVLARQSTLKNGCTSCHGATCHDHIVPPK